MLLEVFQSVLFFRAHRTKDLTRKREKVGPFECDEVEKHCLVSAKCYPTKVPALYTLYTMAKENRIPKLMCIVLGILSEFAKSGRKRRTIIIRARTRFSMAVYLTPSGGQGLAGWPVGWPPSQPAGFGWPRAENESAC